MQATGLWALWQDLLQPFALAFTCPGFRHFVVWVTGLALNVEEHTITQSLIALGLHERWKELENFAEIGHWNQELLEWGLADLLEQAPGRLWHGYRVHAIDDDPDAVQSAGENLALNRDVRHVTLAIADLAETPLPASDVVTANLTGAVLMRSAAPLLAAVTPGGTLIVSGILASESDAVRRAFLAAAPADHRQEDEWVCLTLKKP